jgi:hypothetical protein
VFLYDDYNTLTHQDIYHYAIVFMHAQDYFDKNGIFVSVVGSLPLVLIAFYVMVYTINCYLLCILIRALGLTLNFKFF